MQLLEETLHVGTEAFLASDSPNGRWSTYFEDDGETGYFYAWDLELPDNNILDALHIYNVSTVVDRDRPSIVQIVWSAEGAKCALLINRFPHAMFDFEAKRGYCRTSFPKSHKASCAGWEQSDHSWSDEAASWIQLGNL
ncbi:MAG TPA: DUF2251 domain-containing protein [Candidatus Sulfotelmatobacter sp.]|nr:DUF2251 domain-containing protein [Candidatus Sulfotelmatobacter sp.]